MNQTKIIKHENHLRAPAGIEYPLVMKSVFFAVCSLLPPFVNRLSRFSFGPIIFRLRFFSFSSSRTRAVSIAVAGFLILPDPPPAVGAVDVPLPVLLLLLAAAADCPVDDSVA